MSTDPSEAFLDHVIASAVEHGAEVVIVSVRRPVGPSSAYVAAASDLGPVWLSSTTYGQDGGAECRFFGLAILTPEDRATIEARWMQLAPRSTVRLQAVEGWSALAVGKPAVARWNVSKVLRVMRKGAGVRPRL